MTYITLTDEGGEQVADFNKETGEVEAPNPKNETASNSGATLKKYGLPAAGAAVCAFLGYKFIKDKTIGILGGILVGAAAGWGLSQINITKKTT